MKSVGDILRNQRKKRNLTLESIQKAIKIHPNYIKALEDNDYSVFVDKTHAKGFLKIYAQYLELNVDEVLAFWRREFETHFEGGSNKESLVLKPIDAPKLLLTPKLLLSVLVFLIVSLFFGYLYRQYSSFDAAPTLNISHPINNYITEQDVLDITGQTDPDAEIFINNQKVMVNLDGSFATTARLKEGINVLNIISVNDLEKKTEIVRTVIYRPMNPPEINSVPETTESTSSSEQLEDLDDEELQ